MRVLIRVFATAFVLMVVGACGQETPPLPEDRQQQATVPGAEAPANPADSGCRLKMGWDPWPPFHYTGAGGEITGFDVDVVRALLGDAGCELDFERDSWATLLTRIRDGSIDLVTGATVTDARKEFALFSEPFREEEFALYVRVGETGRWAGDNLRELMEQGLRIGITDEYVYGDAVQEILDEPRYSGQVVRRSFGEANIGSLLEHDIDAFVEDVFAATSMIRRLGFEGAISRHPLSLDSPGEVRIMFSRATVSPELVARINESLARLRESGEYEQIERPYLK